jgi:hypothetical protein
MKSLNLSAEEKAKYKITENDANEEGAIPLYWQNAIKNSKYFAVNEKDELILAHLKDIQLNLVADKLDYSIDFIFDKNEFFNHDKLTIQFVYDDKKFEPLKQTGTNIIWSSSEKNPLLKTKTKKIKSNF